MYNNKLDNIYEPYYSSKDKIYIFSEIVKVSKQSKSLGIFLLIYYYTYYYNWNQILILTINVLIM